MVVLERFTLIHLFHHHFLGYLPVRACYLSSNETLMMDKGLAVILAEVLY